MKNPCEEIDAPVMDKTEAMRRMTQLNAMIQYHKNGIALLKAYRNGKSIVSYVDWFNHFLNDSVSEYFYLWSDLRDDYQDGNDISGHIRLFERYFDTEPILPLMEKDLKRMGAMYGIAFISDPVGPVWISTENHTEGD